MGGFESWIVIVKQGDREMVEIVITVVWTIWTTRNKVRHGGVKKNCLEVVE